MNPPAENQRITLATLREVQHCPVCGRPFIGMPVLSCAHCGDERPLRAYCYRRAAGGYIAECVDLTIASQGQTEEQAIGALQEAVVDYLYTAFDGGSTEGLVLRPSPWSHRARYHLHRFREGLWGSAQGSRSLAPHDVIEPGEFEANEGVTGGGKPRSA